MKTKMLSIAMLMSLATFLSAQNVPNGGFEKWTEGDPDEWSTNNTLVTKVLKQNQVAHSGDFAIKGQAIEVNRDNVGPNLEIEGDTIIGAGFDISEKYDLWTFWYKFDNGNNDKFEAVLIIRDDSLNNIGSADFETDESVSEFTKVEIPIEYHLPGNARKCVMQFGMIDILGSGQPSTDAWFVLDDVGLSLSGGSTGMESRYNNDGRFELSPQPAADQVQLKITSQKIVDRMTFILFDLSGRKICDYQFMNIRPGENEASIDVSKLNNGIYLLHSVDGNFNSRLVVAH